MTSINPNQNPITLSSSQKRTVDEFYEQYGKIVYTKCSSNSLADTIEHDERQLTDCEKDLWAVRIANRIILTKYLTNIGHIQDDPFKKSTESSIETLKTVVETLRTDVEERTTEHIQDYPYIPSGPFNMYDEEESIIISEPSQLNRFFDLVNSYDFTVTQRKNSITPLVLGDAFAKAVNDIGSNNGQQSTGAFYTPNKLAHSIARRSLTNQILNQSNTELDTTYDSFQQLFKQESQQTLKEINDTIISELRIIDPSCGSGHFLIAVLNELRRIKKQIHTEIDSPVTKQILTREIIRENLYGADIEIHAIELCKLRLWIELATQIPPENTEINLPQLQCKFRPQNSLLGLSPTQETITTQSKISTATENNESVTPVQTKREQADEAYAAEFDKVTTTEKINPAQASEYIDSVSGISRVKMNFNRTIDGNPTLESAAEKHGYTAYTNCVSKSVCGISTDTFTTEQSEIESALPDDIQHSSVEITRNISTDELHNLNCLHWPIEYSRVFDDGGFDIVIGNPPHGADISSLERELIEQEYELTNDAKETSKLFIERSVDACSTNGSVWFVLPKSSCYSYSWRDYRNFVKERIIECIDLGEAFSSVSHEQVVVGLRSSAENTARTYQTGSTTNEVITPYDSIPRKSIDIFQVIIPSIHNWEYTLLKEVHTDLESAKGGAEIARGYPLKNGEPALKGRDVQRFYYCEATGETTPNEGNPKRQRIVPQENKVVIQRIASNRSNPKPHIKIVSHHDPHGFLTIETVSNIIPQTIPAKCFALALNTRFANWYIRRTVFAKATRNIDIDEYFINRFPLFEIEQVTNKTSSNSEEIITTAHHLYDALTAARNISAHTDTDISNEKIDEIYEASNLFVYDFFLAGLSQDKKYHTDGTVIDAITSQVSPIDRPDDEFPLSGPSNIESSKSLKTFVDTVYEHLTKSTVTNTLNEFKSTEPITSIESRFPYGLGDEETRKSTSGELRPIGHTTVIDDDSDDDQKTLDSYTD